ncbi:hypothetical protein ACFC09_21050 [Streptomyces sp. NPDC056161]|uniref:hypothetical protein n=1 Tax=Streptomyces sp. NPDC056161 TaxID=3345732 RepID=UPI0035E05A34
MRYTYDTDGRITSWTDRNNTTCWYTLARATASATPMRWEPSPASSTRASTCCRPARVRTVSGYYWPRFSRRRAAGRHGRPISMHRFSKSGGSQPRPSSRG